TLLAALAGLDPAETFQRYTAFVCAAGASAARAAPLAATEHIRFAASTWPTAQPPLRVLWEQLALPTLLWRQGSAVFHSPVNALPLRVPCASVVTLHDLAFLRSPRHLRPMRRLYQRLLTAHSARPATRVVAVSASTRRDLDASFQVPAERVRVISPAIDPYFQPVDDPAALADFRAHHGLPERYLLFL